MLTATAPSNATGVELFKVGRQTDSKGRSKIWTEADLDEIAAAYNSVVSKLHDAPILGEPAAPIQVSHRNQERAYGWLVRAYREGNVLKGDYAYVDPQFAEMVNNKQYRKRSISLYPPDHDSNPTPGKWNIRHVAYVAVPAVKGLADHTIPVNLGEEEGDTWEFDEVDFGTATIFSPMGAIAALFQSLRDQTIAEDGLEKADSAYPMTLIDQVRALENQSFVSMDILSGKFQDMQRQIDELRQIIFNQEQDMNYSETDWGALAKEKKMGIPDIAKAAKLPPDVVAAILKGSAEPDEAQTQALEAVLGKPKKSKTSPTDMNETEELQTQIKALTDQLNASQATIAQLRTEKEKERITNFVERLVAERKILPANKQSTIELAMAMPGDSPVEFSEGNNKVLLTPRDRYLQELDKARPLYSNKPLPTGPADAPYNYQAANTSLSDDDEVIDRSIRRKQQEMAQLLGRHVDYAEAMTELGITY